MDEVGNGIISGAAGGAIAGIVVTVILGASRLVVAKWRRRNQINHIRDMIANERAQIYVVTEQTDLPADSNRPTSDAFRYTYFDGMRRELKLALDGRSSEITFDEIRQIRRVFVLDDLLRSKASGKPPVGLKHYNNIFGDLEKIEWLKLPKRVGGARENE